MRPPLRAPLRLSIRTQARVLDLCFWIVASYRIAR